MRLKDVEAVVRAWKSSPRVGDTNALLRMLREQEAEAHRHPLLFRLRRS